MVVTISAVQVSLFRIAAPATATDQTFLTTTTTITMPTTTLIAAASTLAAPTTVASSTYPAQQPTTLGYTRHFGQICFK